MEKELRKRKEYIDIAKGIGILLVLLGHLLPDNNEIKSMIYSFHMPLFFIVSGYTCKSMGFKTLLYKRVQRILLPYLLWAVIFTGLSLKKLVFIVYGTNETIGRAGSNGMLWFLVCMFVASILGGFLIFLSKKSKNRKLFLGVCVVATLAFSYILNFFHDDIVFKNRVIGLPFAMDISFLATSFFLIGKIMEETDLTKIDKLRLPLRLLIGTVCLAVSTFGIWQTNQKGYSQMATYDIGNPFFYFIVACIASFGLLLLSKELERKLSFDKKGVGKMLTWFGRNSMLLFIMHRTLVYPCKELYLSHPLAMVCIAMWILLTLYSVFTAVVIKRLFPVLAGLPDNRK